MVWKVLSQNIYYWKCYFLESIQYIILLSSFGEAAIKLDISRASTVLALENTHLLYLSEEAFFHLLDPYLSKSLDEKMNYFNNFPIF